MTTDIREVTLFRVRKELVREFETSSHRKKYIEHVLLKATTADGMVGWGEAASPVDPFLVTRPRQTLRGNGQIALRVGIVVNHYKMAKHFTVEITDDSFSFRRDEERIVAEGGRGEIYVLRTNLAGDVLKCDEVVASYKTLACVGRDFRGFDLDLDIPPIRHRNSGCASTCSYVCSPTSSPGTWNVPSKTTTTALPRHNARVRSRFDQPRRSTKPNAPSMKNRSTTSPPC